MSPCLYVPPCIYSSVSIFRQVYVSPCQSVPTVRISLLVCIVYPGVCMSRDSIVCSVCMSCPCVGPNCLCLHMSHRVYVPSVCISLRVSVPPYACFSLGMFLRVYVSPYVCPRRVYVPQCLMSLRVYVPPYVCLIHVYVPNVYMSHRVYIPSVCMFLHVCPLRHSTREHFRFCKYACTFGSTKNLVRLPS